MKIQGLMNTNQIKRKRYKSELFINSTTFYIITTGTSLHEQNSKNSCIEIHGIKNLTVFELRLFYIHIYINTSTCFMAFLIKKK